ncbi:unnamed protein product [Hymenolepis diminuta]|uniref:Uncharacterized protein n=1 Tax=Hymenolepis diminuta TaxID=6216 RepID=A0A564YLQ0_HYMDI|nr:unnamed protein product [Hymenolepis diminuta]
MFLLHNRGADLARTDKNGRNALHHAALRNDIISINFLINRKCPKDARDNSGFTPLVLAIWKNNLANGPLHSMPLVTAAYFGFLDILHFLLSVEEPNLKMRKMQMNYALCIACYTGQINSAKLLIKICCHE